MKEPEIHIMLLVEIRKNGSELWECPICNHRWENECPPGYREKIVSLGNELVVHKAECWLSDPEANEEMTIKIDAEKLSPWCDWMRSWEKIN